MDFVVEFADALSRRCPGYCGRPIESPSNVTITGGLPPCQACPWGQRPAADSPVSACVPCISPLRIYDYVFLVFYALVPWTVHALFLRLAANQRTGGPAPQSKRSWLAIQALGAGFESTLAVILTFLMGKPRGSLQLVGCATVNGGGLRVWYPPLVEPTDVESSARSLRCASEFVYPLYSLPFMIFAFCLINAAILRPFLYVLARYGFGVRLPAMPLYATLWALPLCAVAHAVFSGILYYAFPYICVAGALALNAVHLATVCSDSACRQPSGHQIRLLLVMRDHRVEHAVLLSVHAALLAFGSAAILFGNQAASWSSAALLAGALPVPTVFYLLTARLTAPPSRGAVRRR